MLLAVQATAALEGMSTGEVRVRTSPPAGGARSIPSFSCRYRMTLFDDAIQLHARLVADEHAAVW